ncbi:protein A16-like [Saccostrea cucullata]|uniref:protein A16-like n=1 Tax=Saccostrea cuccullata TaxID=36930 RepID=UPI002ED48324
MITRCYQLIWNAFFFVAFNLSSDIFGWTQCTQKNSYLVEMNSAKENKWISEMFLSENGNGNTHLVDTTWIGANRKNGILTWEHSNEPVNLQSWVTNRLDGSGSCVFMEYTGSWTDVRCDRQLHVYAFVCEKML